MRRINQTGYLIQHLSFMLAKQSEQVLQERLGIGFSQFKILRVLQANPTMKQKEIAKHLGQTEASISRQIKLMLAEGLLATKPNPKSKREHLTVATAKGERLTEAAMETLANYHTPTFNSLSEKEQRELLEILEKLHVQVCPGNHPSPLHPKKI